MKKLIMLPKMFDFTQDLCESSEGELSSGEEFVPDSESTSKSNSNIEPEFKNPVSNNSLELCMTTEKKSSSLKDTPRDSLSENLSLSHDSITTNEAMEVCMTR